MKKIMLLSAAAMAALSVASLARAQETQVEFYGNAHLNATTPAGVDGATGWNTLALPNNYLPYGGSSKTTETGTFGGIGVSLTADGWYNNSAPNQISGDPGSTTLLAQGAGTEGSNGTFGADPVTLALSGLTAGQEYSLVVYVGGSPSSLSVGSLALTGALTGDSTQYFMSPGGDGVTYPLTTLQDDATTTDWPASLHSGAYIPAGEPYISNYLVFSGITGTSLTVTLNQLGNFPNGQFQPNGPYLLGESGFELFDVGPAPAQAVPEPSTVWMFSLGFLGLMVHIYRKRYARV